MNYKELSQRREEFRPIHSNMCKGQRLSPKLRGRWKLLQRLKSPHLLFLRTSSSKSSKIVKSSRECVTWAVKPQMSRLTCGNSPTPKAGSTFSLSPATRVMESVISYSTLSRRCLPINKIYAVPNLTITSHKVKLRWAQLPHARVKIKFWNKLMPELYQNSVNHKCQTMSRLDKGRKGISKM